MANNFHLMVSNSLFFACDAAGWYWSKTTSIYTEIKPAYISETETKGDYKKITLLTNNDVKDVHGFSINRIADLGDNYVELISQIVNGGGNAWDKRIGFYRRLNEILKSIYLCKFIFLVLMSFVMSCKNNNTNLLNESKNIANKDTSFICEPCEYTYYREHNTPIDSVILNKGIKTVKVFQYNNHKDYVCRKNIIGFSNGYAYKVILLKNGKIISNREYDESFNSPYGDVEVNFVKKNNNLFTANDTHTSGKSRWVREYEIDWSNMTIIIRNETWEDIHPQKGLLKETHEVNKTIDEYEAEQKAKYGE